jgi:type IV pilus assembly protein PilB
LADKPVVTDLREMDAEGAKLAPDVVPASARSLADLHHVPLVDLRSVGVDKAASDAIPQHVLVRTVAVPYAFDDERLQIAVADPGNVEAVDELRLASPHQIDIAVAPREEIELVLQRLARAAQFNARTAVLVGRG